MRKKDRRMRASQEEIALYALIGEAVCAIQHLEDHLSTSIVIKQIPNTTPKKQANLHLEKKRKYTLGKAIKEAKEHSIFSEDIYEKLEALLPKRNWLIHGSVSRYREDLFIAPIDKMILEKVKAVTNDTNELYDLLEEDLLSYCDSNGKDLSKIRDAIAAYYS